MLIDVQMDKFADMSYSTTGLSSSKATIEKGGYCAVGKLVILNIRLRTSAAISTGDTILSGLPLPTTGDVHVAVSTGAYDRAAYIDNTGAMKVSLGSSVSSGNVIVFSTTYIAK